jgi:DNA-binding GntR family transcriptional regulator
LARFLIFVNTGEVMERKHKRLIRALRSRDVAVARQAILDEIDETRKITLEHVIQKDGAFWHVGTRTA